MRFFLLLFILIPFTIQPQSTEIFSVEDIMSYPFTYALTSARNIDRIAWVMNERGTRNIYVADGPGFSPRNLTNFDGDDGQELSSVQISDNGQWVVYIRGGDFGSNWDDALTVNPNFLAEPPKVHIWSIPVDGGPAISHGEGEHPVISHKGDRIAFVRKKQIWVAPIDGSSKPKKLFTARGTNGSMKWSPDDSKLVFVSNRSDHSFIGVYSEDSSHIDWISPSFHRDAAPEWSFDGSRVAYIRRPGSGGRPKAILEARHNPWKIMIGDPASGRSWEIWKPAPTVSGSPPSTQGRYNLNWGDGYLTFMSYQDGWPHLYSIDESELDGSNHSTGGMAEAVLLTRGDYMAEYISMSPDGKWLAFAGNTGPDVYDIDRRHIVRVSVDGKTQEVITHGEGLEWTPFILSSGNSVAYISATARRPPLPAVLNLDTKEETILNEHRVPSAFPEEQLVVPAQVVIDAPDGTPVHGTLFSNNTSERKAAIIYIHGGPPRQMLLGWHYSSYYSNAYAVNQYLASRGFVVLSVNFRLGIGYGYEFHRPVDGGTRGASEYQDIKAAGEWLAAQSFVDRDRIGVYGGSYGGYLTAMALGRDSELFAAGVDIHGVHDRINGRVNRYMSPNEYEHAPDAERAVEVAWQSSPVADIDTWKSPVLIIHGDDDRNVSFSQSVDLVQRLEEKGIEFETLVIPDDTHHFMTFRNQKKVNEATAEFLLRKLGD